MTLDDKIKEAERTLKLGAEMSEYYYHKPLIICYSGGKDSDVMLDIAKRCLKPNEFEVLNNHTTIDAPETVYHIRKVFKNLESEGIKTTVIMPTLYGEPTSMWKLIVKNLTPPTRLNRYCCRFLKEVTVPDRMICFGVREAESTNRRNRDSFEIWAKTKSEAEYRSLGHTYAMFKLDQNGGEDAYQCKMIQQCKKNGKTVVNPIYRFSDSDVWEYIKTKNLEINPLYAEGFSRVGCIGCPFGGAKNQIEQFNRYPKYKENYIKAFDRMLEERKRKGLPFRRYAFKNGEEVMRWWLGENPNQVRIEDILKEGEEE